MDTYHQDTLYLYENGCEDPWLFFVPRGVLKQKCVGNTALGGEVITILKSLKIMGVEVITILKSVKIMGVEVITILKSVKIMGGEVITILKSVKIISL